VLLLPCGTALFDSRTLMDYLALLHPDCAFFPRYPFPRARELTRMTLADGITDAALLVVYEGRFRNAAQACPRWIDHQRGKIARALTAISTDLLTLDGPPSASVLVLACALDYLEWRKPMPWRGYHPVLVDWMGRFDRSWPKLAQTRTE
jgi:glutathione S-transferase